MKDTMLKKCLKWLYSRRLPFKSRPKRYYVIAKDEMKFVDFTDYPLSIIVNTDDRSQPGTHWVAFYYICPNTVEYHDSFAKNPEFYGIEPLPGTLCHVNSHPIQTEFSSICGELCFLYLFWRLFGFGVYQNIIRRFTNYRDLKIYVHDFMSDKIIQINSV